MFRTLAIVGTVSLVACGGGSPRVNPVLHDFSMIDDASNPTFDAGTDGSAVAHTDLAIDDDAGHIDSGVDGSKTDASATFVATTPNAIDTDTIGGMLGQGAAVKLTGLVVVSPVYAFTATYNMVSKAGCRFEVWAQDPSCTTAPCGILLETDAIANPNGTGGFCDYSADTTTLLGNVGRGDEIDVTGFVDVYAQTGAATDGGVMGTVAQHGVDLTSLAVTATAQAVTATMVTDAAGLFVPYTGTGWAKYEGMFVTLAPSSGTLTVTLDSFGGWTTVDGSHFADNYSGLYRPDGAAVNTWPPTGSTFTSMSGVVSLVFGGAILPVEASDLVGFMAP